MQGKYLFIVNSKKKNVRTFDKIRSGDNQGGRSREKNKCSHTIWTVLLQLIKLFQDENPRSGSRSV